MPGERSCSISSGTISTPKAVDPIYDAWHALPAASRADAERWFRAVWALASKDGLKTVIDEGHFHQLSLKGPLDQLDGIHEKIFWVYLNHELVFVSAGLLNQADHLNTRYWRLRNDLPAKKPDISDPTRELLGQEISKYFEDHQGRGGYCTVEVYERRKTIQYFFVYPSDYADTALVYDDDGAMERQLQKAAFQVIFAYNEVTGALDVFVQGDKHLRHDLEEIFCRLILKEKLPARGPRQPYNLAPLRSSTFEFPTNPEDNITETRVKALRLSVASPGLGRITLEGDERKKRGSVYNLMQKYLNQDRLASGAVSVTQALLEVTFRTDDGEKKIRFRITHPDSCTLRDDPEHLIIKEYLQRWGIATEVDSDRLLDTHGQ